MGFKIADEIAAKVGIFTDSDYRIRSGLFYALLQATGNGHTYLPEEELFANASALLNVEPEHMEKHLVDLQMEKKLVVKERMGNGSSTRRSSTIWNSIRRECCMI